MEIKKLLTFQFSLTLYIVPSISGRGLNALGSDLVAQVILALLVGQKGIVAVEALLLARAVYQHSEHLSLLCLLQLQLPQPPVRQRRGAGLDGGAEEGAAEHRREPGAAHGGGGRELGRPDRLFGVRAAGCGAARGSFN